jgi:hypothetical protein
MANGSSEAANDELVERARGRSLAWSVAPDRVAIGNQVSTLRATAAALPTVPACWPPRRTSPPSCFRSWRTPIAMCAWRLCMDRLVESIRAGVNLVAVSAVRLPMDVVRRA